MTSFECYNMRVANPEAYFVFYDNFLKIVAGQTCCKENMEDGAEGKLGEVCNTSGGTICITVLGDTKQDWLREGKVLGWAE
jgi:hypothetical protein